MSSDASLHDETTGQPGDASVLGEGFLSRFLAVSIVVTVVLSLFAMIDRQNHRLQDSKSVDQALETLRAVTEHELAGVRSDIDLIVGRGRLHDTAYAAGALYDLLSTFADARKQYRRIALLDTSGHEVVRIERKVRGAFFVDSALPDAMPQGEPFPLDAWPDGNEMLLVPQRLDGDTPSATPSDPVLRFAAPLVDNAGARRGLFLIDYSLSTLIQQLSQSIPDAGKPILWIHNGHRVPPYLEISSVSADGSTQAPSQQQEEWAEIDGKYHGYVETADGDFAFITIVYPQRRSIETREPFLLPSDTPPNADVDIMKLAILRKPLGFTEQLLWLLLLAFGLLAPAAVYCSQLAREAQRRSRATAALTASENRLREQLSFNESLLHGLPVPVFVKDADGRYIACNEAFARLVGIPRSAILGRNTADVLPPAVATLHQEMDSAALTQWTEQQYEAEGPYADDALSHSLIFKSPLSIGPRVGVIGVSLDITDRRRAKNALQRSQQFFKRTLNTIPQPVFVKNRRHRFLFVNDAACLYLGFPREQMLGKTDHDFFPAEQADKFVALDDLVFTRGGINLNEETITDAAGNEHVILTTKAVFEDENGEPVLVGVITDITERKRSEELLRIGAEVFEHSSEGIMISDDRGRILMINRAFTRITGYTATEAIGRSVRIIGSGHPNREFLRMIARSLNETGFWKGEVINRRKDGEIYIVEMPICAVRDDASRVRRYIAMMTDITKRKQSEARVSYLAEHDFLTGLANRALLHDRTERALLQAQRTGNKVGALILDLDDFKKINDTWGHAAGDLLLQHVAARLTAAVRQSDTVARVGGDEFVVLLPDVHEREDAGRVARALSTTLTKPYALDNVTALVGVSCGIAVYPDDAGDVEGLFRVADAAMYRTKQRRRYRAAEKTSPRRRRDPARPAGERSGSGV